MAIYIFIFSFERTFETIYNTLLPVFFSYLAYFYKYFDCPLKYQDHSKPLKHLPINILSATNTFIWLIPVVTSPKLP